MENAAEKQAKSLQTLNTNKQLKSIGDLLSKDFLIAAARDQSEKI